MADITEADIRAGYQSHAALAQFYRWFQVYERPEGGIDNALDLLTEEVVVTSGLGTATGQAEYAARVGQLPTSWRNAHHVQAVTVTPAADGAAAVQADVLYQNLGALPEEGAVRQVDLSYTIALEPGNTVLPKLSEVSIEAVAEPAPAPFEDAYAVTRMRSLVHYWLALIEDPARDPAPFAEILAEEFSLNFSSGAITDLEGFAGWLAGPGSQVVASTHVISDFTAEELSDDHYRVEMIFDWAGLLPNGTELVAKTRHDWRVENDVTERFARIETVDVEVLEPFRPRDQ